MLPLLLAALLGASALFIVLAPLFAPGRAAQATADSQANGFVDREALAKQALREVEFDHQLGNLAEDDYRALRERYTRRALAAMKGRYDKERLLDEVIEAQVRALRESSAPPAATRGSHGARSAAPTPTAPRRTGGRGTGGASPRKRSGNSPRGNGRGR